MSDATVRLNATLEGRYHVERVLGEGGMATVYLTDDLRHGRKVALKVLRPELAAVVGAERFLAEIRTTASLQHPHILPLHDSGVADGLLFYVMPHVEGESLRARLDREHQLPVDEAVRIATNVAEALDYAHRHGVIHRDIKPANILLLDGKPVISDFGIALAVTHAGSSRLTETGLSLGTPHYMSPEQATGDASVGPATDVWALGCVLYEMLVGEPPYTGSAPQAVLGKIITAEPASASEARRSVPPNVDAAIRKALEKVPADRFTGAAAFARALGDLSFTHGPAAAAPAASRSWIRLAAGSVALAAALAVGAAWGWLRPPPGASAPVVRASILVPEGFSSGGLPFAISHDGRSLAYATLEPDGQSVIHLRRLAEEEGRPLLGTEGAQEPVFSPDDEWLAFVRGDSLLKLRLDGGPPVLVTRGMRGGNAPGGSMTHPSWARDGTILFVSHAPPGDLFFTGADAIYRVPDTGGQPELLASPGARGRSYRWPELLPDGRRLLFTAYSGAWEESEVRMLDLATGEMRTLVASGAHARYVEPTGHILYGGSDQALYAVPFDAQRGEPTGAPLQLLARVPVVRAGGATRFHVSTNGVAVYQAGEAGGGTSLVLADRGGGRTTLRVPPGTLWDPRFSRDGRHIAYGRGGRIYTHDLELGPIRLLTNLENSWQALWSDDRSVTFSVTSSGHVFRQALDEDGVPEGAPEQLVAHEAGYTAYAWTRDGRLLAAELRADEPADLVVLSFDGDSVSRTPYLEADWDEQAAALSPDERWVAYVSDETGQEEVYVRSFPEPRASVRVSQRGGVGPAWSPDGRTLYYQEGGELRAASVRIEPDFEVLARETVIVGILGGGLLRRQYDVHPAGDRFVVKVPTPGTTAQLPNELTLVLNWFQELRERVGN